MYSEIIFLYYFDDLTGAFLTSLVFCVATFLGSIVAAHLPELWYGAGVVFGFWTNSIKKLAVNYAVIWGLLGVCLILMGLIPVFLEWTNKQGRERGWRFSAWACRSCSQRCRRVW